MALSTNELRSVWAKYACNTSMMQRIPFGPDTILVAKPTIDAWKALASVIESHGYDIRIEDTDSYNCRQIKGGSGKSLHSYGIALDINWKTNPYRDHKGTRPPRFSKAAIQTDRAEHVRLGKADTDMTREMIDAACAIRTRNGKQVFGWGGNWQALKDSMHFQIEVSPADLATGVDPATVPHRPAANHTPPSATAPDAAAASSGRVAMPRSMTMLEHALAWLRRNSRRA